jgi:hypothetical protein
MRLEKGFFLLLIMIGIILLSVYFITNKFLEQNKTKVIYKMIPRTLEEEEESPIYVSQIFKTMFSQPSTWINSVDEETIRRQESLNNYFISLM